MSETQAKKPGRKSSTTAKSEVGQTREEFIKGLVALEMPNDEIWSAVENRYPAIIEDKKRREERCKALAVESVDYDAHMRKRVGEQIRSVKGLARKDDELMEGIVDENTDAENLAETQYSNRKRFSCGWPALDHIYGETLYRHPDDEPKGKWKKGDAMMFDKNGKLMATRDAQGELLMDYSDLAKACQKVEFGLPHGYMGFWGGSPGVGKSRTAIDLTHSLNRLGHMVLYFNGEAEKQDFRAWAGPNVHPTLFKVFHAENDLVPLSTIEANAYKYKAPVIIIDSFQMIAETQKGQAGQKRVLSRLKLLKADPEAGCPHIIIISQLNKKLELAGSKYLEHMVDYSIKVWRHETKQDHFYMDSMKMRGAQCPRGKTFKHTPEGVICTSTEASQSRHAEYALAQANLPAAMARGVVAAPPAEAPNP